MATRPRRARPGDLREPIKRVLVGGPHADVVLAGHNRRGQPIECTVALSPLRVPIGDLHGAILVIAVERQPS